MLWSFILQLWQSAFYRNRFKLNVNVQLYKTCLDWVPIQKNNEMRRGSFIGGNMDRSNVALQLVVCLHYYFFYSWRSGSRSWTKIALSEMAN